MLERRYENTSSERGREMLIKRRKLVQLLSITSSALLTSDIDWDRVEVSLKKLSQIDDALMCDLEIINSR
jgi:hypothetical protein